MKLFKSICFLGIIALIFSGCWIALPTDGQPGAQEYIGHTYLLQRDILIVSYWLTPISWEVHDKESIGKSKKFLRS
jgi:hypothetical protein